MADKIELTINDQSVKADKGMTILEAALRKGIYIPHLCHHSELEPVGACRLCQVEIDGKWKKTVIACKTQVKDGMIVRTETPEINEMRQIAVELLIADHDTDCLACAQDTSCALQRVANHVGINKKRLQRLKHREEKLPIDDSNPFFSFDPNRCVLCGICVRTCDELQKVQAIDYAYRGLGTKIAGFGDKPRIESSCESCGECIVRCPVGALTEKDYLKPTHQVKTICTFLRLRLRPVAGRTRQSDRQCKGGSEQPRQQRQTLCQGPIRLQVRQSPRSPEGTACKTQR